MSQGTNSNRNGRAMEERVAALLTDAGVPFERSIRRYQGIGPKMPVHDILGRHRKHADVRCILVLGGNYPTDHRWGYLEACAVEQGVQMVAEDRLVEVLCHA